VLSKCPYGHGSLAYSDNKPPSRHSQSCHVGLRGKKRKKGTLLRNSRPRRASEGLVAPETGRRRAGTCGHFPPSPPRRGDALSASFHSTMKSRKIDTMIEVGVARQVASTLQLARAWPRARPSRARSSTRRPPRWFGRATDEHRPSPYTAWPYLHGRLSPSNWWGRQNRKNWTHFLEPKNCALIG
jgi:hypothetical protein